MVHLEQRGILKNQFHNKFRTKPAWKVDLNAPHPYPEYIQEEYIKTGNSEDANAYNEYYENTNIGSEKHKTSAKQTD